MQDKGMVVFTDVYTTSQSNVIAMFILYFERFVDIKLRIADHKMECFYTAGGSTVFRAYSTERFTCPTLVDLFFQGPTIGPWPDLVLVCTVICLCCKHRYAALKENL